MRDYSHLFGSDVYNFNTVDKQNSEVELEQVCGFLKKAGIRHWLSAGTMLGVYRDGRFLKGDTDIDIGIIGKDVKDIQSAIPWKLRPSIKTDRTWQSIFTTPRNIAIDLAWFWEEGDNIVNEKSMKRCGRLVKPKDKMAELGTLEFKGVKYPVPNPEWYLEHRFKDWKKRIPKNGKSWESFAGDFLEV